MPELLISRAAETTQGPVSHTGLHSVNMTLMAVALASRLSVQSHSDAVAVFAGDTRGECVPERGVRSKFSFQCSFLSFT